MSLAIKLEGKIEIIIGAASFIGFSELEEVKKVILEINIISSNKFFISITSKFNLIRIY